MKIVRRNAMVGLFWALGLLCSPFTAKAAQSSQTDQAALVQLEKEAWDVAKQKNWQAYNRLLSQDFVWIDAWFSSLRKAPPPKLRELAPAFTGLAKVPIRHDAASHPTKIGGLFRGRRSNAPKLGPQFLSTVGERQRAEESDDRQRRHYHRRGC